MSAAGQPSRVIRTGAVACLMAAVVAAALGTSSALASSHLPTVVLIEVKGAIDPPTADYLSGELQAAADGAYAVVIQVDTPGGLDTSMRAIITQILESPVPVVVWIAPRGARAASAGTFIAYAAHRTYMAEATELGAATPINLAGGESDTLTTKVTNDAVAYIEEIARLRGRNAEWAEDAVREGASIGATEAVEIDVVDGMASSLSELLQELDGETIDDLATGDDMTLDTWDHTTGAPSVNVRFSDMNVFQRLLHTITNPEIAFLLILLGTFGLIFELYNPGIGLAGLLGAVSLLLGFYALSVLPTNWAGVLLIIAAVIFLLVDLHTAGLGIWTVAGVAALVAGGLILFSAAPPALELDRWAIALAVALTLLFFISVMTAALRVRLRRPIIGEEGIVGTVGEAKTDIAPEGTVATKGALWRARTMETGIAAGSKVRIKATEGLVLLVEPLHDAEPAGERTHGSPA